MSSVSTCRPVSVLDPLKPQWYAAILTRSARVGGNERLLCKLRILQGAVSGVVGTAKGLGRSVKRLGVSAVSGAKALLSSVVPTQQQQDITEAGVPKVKSHHQQ